MPRLSNHEYFRRHDELRVIWRHAPELFTTLTPAQQYDLHIYYCTERRMTNQQLIAHRRDLDQSDPSLAQRAGKAYAVICVAIRQRLAAEARGRQPKIEPPVQHIPAGPRTLTVSAVMRPTLDLNLLAAVVRELAIQIGSERQAKADRLVKHRLLRHHVAAPDQHCAGIPPAEPRSAAA